MKSVNQFVKLFILLILVACVYSKSEEKESNGNRTKSDSNTKKTTTTMTSPSVNNTSEAPLFSNMIFVSCAAAGGIFFLLFFLFFILVRKYRKTAQAITVTAELRRVSVLSFKPSILSASPINSPNSPVYCEASDIFHFPSSELPSETANTEVRVEEIRDLEDEYSYPDSYETMNEQGNPLRASEEYSYAYGHIIVNTDYINVPARVQMTNDTHDEDDLEYEYVEKSKNSTEDDEDYGYAYDHRSTFNACFAKAHTPSAPAQEYIYKDDDDGEVYENYPTILEKENETAAPLEYINVL